MSEQKETVFLDGFIFKRPREGAPDFVKGEMSIKADDAIAFIQKHTKNGWLNADLLASKDNTKLYFKLNTWEKPVDANAPVAPTPAQQVPAGEQPPEVIDESSIPF
jgi:hypothetical protein